MKFYHCYPHRIAYCHCKYGTMISILITVFSYNIFNFNLNFNLKVFQTLSDSDVRKL